MWAVATTDVFDAILQKADRQGRRTLRSSLEGAQGQEESEMMAKSFDNLVNRTATKTTRRRAAVRARELLQELLLSEIRRLRGKSQKEVAAAIGIKQPSLSKLEKQSDMQISTLSKIVEALGGELEVRAKFPKGVVKIDQFARSTRRPKQHRTGGPA